jgi:hypothetical protein
MARNSTQLLMLPGIKRGRPVTKLAKILFTVTCAAMLSASTVGPARYAYAQDAAEADANVGAWSAPDAEQSVPQAKVHPLKIKGCWSGDVMDAGDGLGTATFQFNQNSTRKKLVVGSIAHFEWSDGAKATVPMRGPVTSTGFSFKGNAGVGCTLVTGSGTGNATALTGTVVFVGACASIFQAVTFSITPGCN